MYLAMTAHKTGEWVWMLNGEPITDEQNKVWEEKWRQDNPQPHYDPYQPWRDWHNLYQQVKPKHTFVPDGGINYKPFRASGNTGPSLYDTPKMAQRYAGKNGYVLMVDLDLLPRYGAEEYEDNEQLAVKFMDRAAAKRKLL